MSPGEDGGGIRRLTWLSLLLVAIVYLVSLGVLEKRGFWIEDNANKFLQLKAILASGYTDYSIPLPGRAIDPEYEFNPMPQPFSAVRGDRLYSQYSPVFAAVSAPAYALLGPPGLYLLPLCASLLMLIGIAQLTTLAVRGDGLAAPLAVLLAGLCTPIWFYSVVFWEHTLAACACVWAVVFAMRFTREQRVRPLVLASIIAAAGIYMREELVMFYAVMLAVILAAQPQGRSRAALVSLAGFAIALAPLLVFQGLALGTPWGVHVAANAGGLSEHVSARPTVIYRLLAAAGSNVAVSLFLTAPFVALLIWFPRLSAQRFRAVFPWLAAVAALSAAVSLGGHFSAAGPIEHMRKSNSLFPAAPFILLALLRPAAAAHLTRARQLRLIILGYALLYAVAAPAISSRGIHWGNRFLLPVYPLLAVMAAWNLTHWLSTLPRDGRRGALPIAAVLGLSLVAQVYSIHVLGVKKEFSHRLNEALRSRPEQVIVSSTWWVPQALFEHFYERPMFCAHSREQYDRLHARLSAQGCERYLFISRADRPADPAAGTILIDDGPLDFFSVSLTPVAPSAR